MYEAEQGTYSSNSKIEMVALRAATTSGVLQGSSMLGLDCNGAAGFRCDDEVAMGGASYAGGPRAEKLCIAAFGGRGGGAVAGGGP